MGGRGRRPAGTTPARPRCPGPEFPLPLALAGPVERDQALRGAHRACGGFLLQVVDASEDVIKPVMPEECQLDRMTLMMGYAGVYSSFLKHAGNAADRYGVSGAKILLEAGRRKLIGGQEDQLIDIALMLKAEQDKQAANAG